MFTRLAIRIGRHLSFSIATATTAAIGIAAGIGCGSASADPVLDTTCTFQQVVSALNAQDPAAAAQFNTSPVAQGWLSQFLGASPDRRQELVEVAETNPEGQPFVGAIHEVAGVCNNY